MSDNNSPENTGNTSSTEKPKIVVGVESEVKVDENLTSDSTEGRRESTRSRIAVIYVFAFFATIGCTFIIGLIKCFAVKDYIDFLIAVSGILSGPLGFIIGYYFKASDGK